MAAPSAAAGAASLYKQTQAALTNKFAQSAVCLASLVQARIPEAARHWQHPDFGSHLDATNLFGQAALANKEFRRANRAFNDVIDGIQVLLDHARDEIPVSLLSGTRDYANIPNLRMNIAKCHQHLGDEKEAFSQLTCIPAASRSVEMHQLIGDLGAKLHEPHAIIAASYLAVLQAHPFAVELIPLIFAHEGKLNDVMARLMPSATLSAEDSRHLQELALAHHARQSHNFAEAIRLFTDLSCGQETAEGLTDIAQCYFEKGDTVAAIEQFRKVRKLDKFAIRNMDEYGLTLWSAAPPECVKPAGMSMSVEIAQLSTQLFSISEDRSESWIVAAISAFALGNAQGVAVYLEMAEKMSPTNALTFIVRGDALMEFSDSVTAAMQAYKTAMLCRSSAVCTYRLCAAVMKQQLADQAVMLARSAVNTYKNDPRALVLLGNAIGLRDPAQAQVHLETARRQRLSYVDALLPAASFAMSVGKYQNAIKMLLAHPQAGTIAAVQSKLGQAYAALGQSSNAVVALQLCLSLDPANEAAKAALDTLQHQQQ